MTRDVRIAESSERERHAGEPAELARLADHPVAAQLSSANIARTARRRAATAAMALSSSTTTAMMLASVSCVFSTRSSGLTSPPSPVSTSPGNAESMRVEHLRAQLLVVAEHRHEDRVADGECREHREQRRVRDPAGEHAAAARSEPGVGPHRAACA